MSEASNIGPQAFAGTAAAYLRHRVPYPVVLLKDLLDRVQGRERLLDLACGPGRLALPLAAAFTKVWAVDREPEMVEAGRGEADRLGIANMTWRTGRAEDFDAPPASFDLIVIGEAFHRLDQRVVAARCAGWLKRGGCLAILGGVGILGGQEPWQRLVADRLLAWTRDAFPQGWATSAPGAGSGIANDEQILRDTGFSDVASHDFIAPHSWSIAEILGYLRSTSVASARILGDRVADFDADLTAALLAHDPSGRYDEQLRFGYTLGRKPD